jgi:hypothetical protein
MSTVDPSSLRLPAAETGVQSRLANALRTGLTAVRGLAFWTTIPLPLVIVGALLTGVLASAPLAVVGLVVLNVLCAAVGQPYTPNR